MRDGQKDKSQMALPFGAGHDHTSLRRFFERVAGQSVSLTLTDNSTSLFSMRAASGTLSLRLHRMFLRASDEVLLELAEYVRGRKKKTPLFWKFVRTNDHSLKGRPRRKIPVKTAGRHHDLGAIYRMLNGEYFGGTLQTRITWGTQRVNRSARRKTLGSYSAHTDTIRISPALDRRSVPGYFVEFIVYHEMLHAHVGVEEKNGRRTVHSEKFKEKEMLFRHYHKALEWERRHLR